MLLLDSNTHRPNSLRVVCEAVNARNTLSLCSFHGISGRIWNSYQFSEGELEKLCTQALIWELRSEYLTCWTDGLKRQHGPTWWDYTEGLSTYSLHHKVQKLGTEASGDGRLNSLCEQIPRESYVCFSLTKSLGMLSMKVSETCWAVWACKGDGN